jgi:hypothetical protein
MKKRQAQTEITLREYDNKWQVLCKASLVRLGLTNRELVKSGEAVDLTQWITVHVANSYKDAKKWLDSREGSVLRLSTPYEVA